MIMPNICLVHLVRKHNGLLPFKTFTDSYRKCRPRIAHDLVFIFKGFEREIELENYQVLLDGIDYKTLFVSDKGFDISSYFAATMEFDHQFFCYLNSHSVLLDRGWLEKLHAAMHDGVGAVGATGSWQSLYSDSFLWTRPGAEQSFLANIPRFLGRRLRGMIRYRRDFAPFPNYHLRTNAFLLPREVMLTLMGGPMRSRMDALRFESGKRGLTSQILGMNLRVLVVGRDGKAYAPEQWPVSRTFRSGNQSNLLVADNRTTEYLKADPDRKRLMEEVTWGRGTGLD